jgi:hypothetical protein
VDTDTGAVTVTFWRPSGPEEIARAKASGCREWPPRLPEQPVFYPVLNEEDATKIARDIVGLIEVTAEYRRPRPGRPSCQD